MMRRSVGTEFSPGLVRSSFPRELARRFPARSMDKILLVSALGLTVFGIVMIYSATRADPAPTFYLKRQLTYFFLALLMMLVGAGFDYRKIMPYSRVIYGITVFLLMLVFLFPAVNGAHRWISLWFFDFQPSEAAKIAVIFVLATFIADRRMEVMNNRDFLRALGLVLIPMFLIFLEPDLGITISVFAIFVGMMLIGGARLRQMAVLGVGTVAAVGLSIWLQVLKEYQLERLLVFVKPDLDPLGSGYNLLQSKIAIGSGQLVGRGLFQGTQTNLKFIPSHHTDFIFSVVGEELGFIGAMVLLMLFAMLIWRGFKIASSARDYFGTMLAVGIVVMFLFQILVNVGMTMGIMPVTGITLPFISFGGSSLLVNFFSVGLLLNVGIRRFHSPEH